MTEPRSRDDAAMASNWVVILVVDSLLGWVLIGAGAILLFRSGGLLGWMLVLIGACYFVLVGRRFMRWRRLRAEAGLSRRPPPDPH
jgi:hypothetical protein